MSSSPCSIPASTLDHPDLASGIWTNPQEDAENSDNGIDDDGNGFIDDVHGWNFATEQQRCGR